MWLWGLIASSLQTDNGTIHGPDASFNIRELQDTSRFGDQLEKLRGRSVVVAVRDQLAAALALVELDGVAARIVLCPPGLMANDFAHIARASQADTWLGDSGSPADVDLDRHIGFGSATPLRVPRRQSCETEWVLLTSGTAGVPKLVLHTLATLTSAITSDSILAAAAVWATFYDLRRYGGLQIFFRGLLSGALVLPGAGESAATFLARAGAVGVTHISGTPSHWRKALMSGAGPQILPRYVRLSGEIADQGILEGLRDVFPKATIAHAFASTEAGVGFEIRDGKAGFPATLVGQRGSNVELDVSHNVLRLRSPGNALKYLGDGVPELRQADGFVDTGDKLEMRDGRYFFSGRSGGVINVGGLKVHPEEVEAVINTHPWVAMSRVMARKSPITGAVVAADIVLADRAAVKRPSDEQLKQEIALACSRALAAHKVPVTVRLVLSLEVSPSGKLVRANA